MKIAICDDDKYFINSLLGHIKYFENTHGCCFMIYEFLNGENLYEFCQDNFDLDIIFLDVVLAHSNGIDIAKKIRKLNQRVKIIFMSSYKEYATEGYGINADGYLLKPLVYSKIEEKLTSAIAKISTNQRNFYCDLTDKGKVLLNFDDIIYIETYNRQTKIHTREEDFLSYTKMKEYEEQLKNHGFCRCHAAYIVNLQYVHKINLLTLILKDKSEIQISKARKKDFMNVFVEYVGKLFDE